MGEGDSVLKLKTDYLTAINTLFSFYWIVSIEQNKRYYFQNQEVTKKFWESEQIDQHVHLSTWFSVMTLSQHLSEITPPENKEPQFSINRFFYSFEEPITGFKFLEHFGST